MVVQEVNPFLVADESVVLLVHELRSYHSLNGLVNAHNISAELRNYRFLTVFEEIREESSPQMSKRVKVLRVLFHHNLLQKLDSSPGDDVLLGGRPVEDPIVLFGGYLEPSCEYLPLQIVELPSHLLCPIGKELLEPQQAIQLIYLY